MVELYPYAVSAQDRLQMSALFEEHNFIAAVLTDGELQPVTIEGTKCFLVANGYESFDFEVRYFPREGLTQLSGFHLGESRTALEARIGKGTIRSLEPLEMTYPEGWDEHFVSVRFDSPERVSQVRGYSLVRGDLRLGVSDSLDDFFGHLGTLQKIGVWKGRISGTATFHFPGAITATSILRNEDDGSWTLLNRVDSLSLGLPKEWPDSRVYTGPFKFETIDTEPYLLRIILKDGVDILNN